MSDPSFRWWCASGRRQCRLLFWGHNPKAHPSPVEPEARAVDVEVNDGGRVEREQLADDQPADNRDPKRLPELCAVTVPDGEGDGAKDRGHCRHEDRPEAQLARLEDRIAGAQAL